MNRFNKRLLLKPKYKIGDIIVFASDDEGITDVLQGVIVNAYGLIDLEDKKDTLYWYYQTKEIIENGDDSLHESEIFYKLK